MQCSWIDSGKVCLFVCLFYITFINLCMFMCGDMDTKAHMWRSEENLWSQFFSSAVWVLRCLMLRSLGFSWWDTSKKWILSYHHFRALLKVSSTFETLSSSRHTCFYILCASWVLCITHLPISWGVSAIGVHAAEDSAGTTLCQALPWSSLPWAPRCICK